MCSSVGIGSPASQGRLSEMIHDTCKVLVTGAAGFIGKKLTYELRRLGFDVIGVDVVDDEFIFRCDILNLAELTRYFDGVDTVIHLAGAVHGKTTLLPHDIWLLQNVGTINALKAVHSSGSRRLVLASSFYVYSGIRDSEIELAEDASLDLATMNDFGSSKYTAEVLVRDFAQRFGIEYVIHRIGSVYGPGKCTNIVKDIMLASLNRTTLKVWGRGERRNQYTYLNDVVDCIIKSISSAQGIYNIVTPERISVKQLIEICQKEFELSVEFDESKKEGLSFPPISANKAIKLLDWLPTTVSDGITRTWLDLQQHLSLEVRK